MVDLNGDMAILDLPVGVVIFIFSSLRSILDCEPLILREIT